MRLSDEASDHMIGHGATVDLLQDRVGFTWKGHDQLPPKMEPLSFAPGFQPVVLVQCMPPAAITAVTLHAEWNLIAFGTSHGFCLFDYHRRHTVLARCTLHPNDCLALEGPLSGLGEETCACKRSFQQGGQRPADRAAVPPYTGATPVQRRIEPRSADDSLSGVVRCLCLTDTYLRDERIVLPRRIHLTGLNMCMYSPQRRAPWPHRVGRAQTRARCTRTPWSCPWQRFSERSVEAVLGKEIQLMHRAPVLAIAVLDGRGAPLPEPYEASQDLAKAPDMQASHSVLIASEEQFKVFTLPKISAKTKFKLTAHEGCRVRKVALASFGSASAEEYSENALVCLTNLGDVRVFSVPALRPQVRYDCMRKEDIAGIASCTLTRTGQGFYLTSPSEYKRFSLSTRAVVEPRCSLDVERPHDSPALRSDATMPLQANGTHEERPAGESLSLQETEGGPEGLQTSLSSPSLESPNSCTDITLDITGDITSEDVKEFLVSAAEADNNLRNISEEAGLLPGILIN
ncbi:hypothetical protein SKAU_G00293700 [Synaphobranchus kaupii]|uniref:Lethal giant larvae (Lgl)-like C-terminal domain-containing protein n=1 Tax=Synaphobranchus kaupii TaxID=118154 RepID=A0A9Q1ILM0_SYNKA|nr:hypothetical protein SKAU_G00293700 [Synaphobranchus kaupii]